MSYAYGAAGLTLVADLRLPHLPPTSRTAADITVCVGTRPDWASGPTSTVYASPYTNAYGVPVLQLARAPEGYAFTYVDGCRFWIDASGSTVWLTYETTIDDACTYLIGPVLSFALRLRGDFSLHASAVATASGSVAFAGPHGVGKSTTAAAFGRRGLGVLTDDILRLTRAGQAWRAHPVGGILRLWEEGESLLFGAAHRLHAITPNWNKRALRIGADGVAAATGPVHLAGVVFLVTDEDADRTSIVPLPQAEAAVRLAANSSAAYLIDSAARAREFQHVADIAASVPCVLLTRPVAPSSLDDTIAALSRWMETLNSSAVVTR